MQCPTYPARPVNGGPLPMAHSKPGLWTFEPKYNGWRGLIHVPTGEMFNRKGKRLTIESEFLPALHSLRATLDAEAFKWVDVEALERRHGIGQGCLIVLDVIPESTHAAVSYTDRHRWIEFVLPRLEWNVAAYGTDFPLVSVPPQCQGSLDWWNFLKETNRTLGVEFYEGMVAKRNDSAYPIQLRSPDFETGDWMKHRWSF
jgi:hypothetical protein